MGSGYGPFVAMYTAFSVGGMAWHINGALQRVFPDISGVSKGVLVDPEDAATVINSLLESSFTIALLANLLVNVFVIVALSMKTIFFGTLTLLETQRVVERLINYVLFKGLFLTWVVQPQIMQVALWLAWFAVLGFLKIFQGLARDRLDRLNASPSATVISHCRAFSVLLLVLLSDLFWIQLCLLVFKDTGISTFMLLLFEPLSIAFETLQAVLVHGVQLLDTWHRQNVEPDLTEDGLQQYDRTAAGASWEWRGMVVRNCSFVMDVISLLLALGHCLHIWWLRGIAFQVVDAILFLNLRALVSAILKRIKGYMRVQTAMNTLQGALPDATKEEILGYDDDCAICKEPMGRAKRLPCSHLFHLSCLRSWLDQGIQETYSCPTCRRPLFTGSSTYLPPRSLYASVSNEQQAGAWRGSEAASEWIDGQQSSSEGPSRGISRISFMMRHFSGSTTGSNHGASTSSRGLRGIEVLPRTSDGRHADASSRATDGWTLWPFGSSGSSSTDVTMVATSTSTARARATPSLEVLTMARTVREVLPHVSDETILEDLLRTNCVITTVNNLL